VAVLDHALGQFVVVEVLDGLFARSVDGADNDFRGVIEASYKVVKQIPDAGVPMGLKHGDDSPSNPCIRSGLQGCADFGWVMAVIVNDGDWSLATHIHFGSNAESPIHARKPIEAVGYGVEWDVEFQSDGNGR